MIIIEMHMRRYFTNKSFASTATQNEVLLSIFPPLPWYQFGLKGPVQSEKTLYQPAFTVLYAEF